MNNVSFYSIPGNIKQSLLPFQIKPMGYINQISENSSTIKGVIKDSVTSNIDGGDKITKYPQIFSFKTIFNGSGNAEALSVNLNNNVNGLGKISFIPQTYEKYFDFDISHKLLYTQDGKDLTFTKMLDNIPSIQIREFLPDTKLDQLLELIAGLMDVLKRLFSGLFSDSGSSENKNESDKTSLTTKLKNVLVYLTGTIDPSLITDIVSLYDIGERDDTKKSNQPNELDNIKSHSANNYVIKLVYLLYCKLQSFTTTNIYELPGEVDGGLMYKSPNGKLGWTSGKGAGQLGLSDLGPDFLSKIIPNITVNYMPFWDAKDVAKADPEVKLKISLVNDNLNSAIHNFIFVNTIVPNNRYLQYNIFQHSPCLYDVKIDGFDRLFACAANINVKYQGTLRNPQKLFYEKLKSHVNEQLVNDKEQFIASLQRNKLIKIPDTYELDISFQSILPLSYNRMLFNYVLNFDQLDNPRMYQESLFKAAIDKVSTSFGEVWSGTKTISEEATASSLVGKIGKAIDNIFG